MHKASAEYFKQRSLYSRAELDRCQALSHQSDRKIRTAQVSVHVRVKTGGGDFSKRLLDGESPHLTFLPGAGFLANGGVFPSYHSGSVLRSALSGLHPASRLPCVVFAKRGRPGGHPLGAPPPLKTPLLRRSPYVHPSDGWRDGWRVCLSTYAAARSRRRALPPPQTTLCTQHIVLGHITLTLESASCRAGAPATFTSCCEYITRTLVRSQLLSVQQPSVWHRRVAYSARLVTKDLHLGDNHSIIGAVMWDEVKADRETVMYLYQVSCPALALSQVLHTDTPPPTALQ